MDEARIEDISPSDIPPTPETVEEDIEIVMEKVKTEEAFTDEAADPGQDNTVALLVGVAVGVLTLILIFIYTRRRSLGREVLITGICDSGKTTILCQLVAGSTRQTYTSMQHNTFPFPVDNKPPVQLVDVPGSDRVRGQVVDTFSSSARGVVFVVDSGTVTKQVRDVAEYLHFLLTNRNILGNAPPVLIVCNKQDSGMAKGKGAVQTLLEKEIEKVRMTRSSQLAGTQTEADTVFLGREGKQFELRDLDCRVEFEEASALDLDTLQGVRRWICGVA